MPSKILALLFFAAFMSAQGTFSLDSVVVPRPVPGPQVFIEVNTSGTPPATGLLEDPGNWLVFASETEKSVIPVLGFTPRWISPTGKVRITFDSTQLAGRDPRIFGWNVVYRATVPNLTAKRDPAKKPDLLSAAKGKDDADIYLFGSYLAGVSTKPIYVIDAKFNWLIEITKGAPDPVTKKKPGTGWFAGVKSSISTNTDTKAPNDRTEVDPDAIDGSLSIEHIWTPKRPPIDPDQPVAATPRHALQGIDFDIRPLGGEFARKYPASNLMTKGYATLVLSPWKVGKDLWAALYPSAGYEMGTNLNQPSILFKQPVDLSGWNGIARAVFITKGELYGLQAKPKDGSIYRFTLDAAYQPRIPFLREPFVTSEFVAGKRVSVTRLRKNTRHEVEAGLNWNFNKFLALRVQYRYGALPPLFEFVDHQATIGLTFKAKQGNKP